MQNKFFNSKLNTLLLSILIILMIIALSWMSKDKEKYFPQEQQNIILNNNQNTQPQETQTPVVPQTPKPQVSSGEIRLAGVITAEDHGCYVDGICKVQINNSTWVIYEQGKMINQDVKGMIEGELKTGAKVEIYAKVSNTQGTYTIFGSDKYYIKVTK